MPPDVLTLNEDQAAVLLSASGLTKRFSTNETAVDDVHLSVRGGEIYCLLGGRGSGKTAIVRMLLGLLRPSAGAITIAGDDVLADPLRARQQITLIAGSVAWSGAMTARHALEFFVGLCGSPSRATEIACRNAMRAVGIPERDFDRRVAGFPRALVVKLWLAVAALRDTPVVILDEPTMDLDTVAIADLQTQLQQLRTLGKAVFVTTADVLFASQVADRIGVLKRGRLAAERTRAEVLSLSLTQLYLDYVGRPPARLGFEPPPPRSAHT